MTIYADAAQPPRPTTRHEQFLLLRTTGLRFDGYRDHKSIISTQIYTHTSDEALFRAVQELPC